VKQKVPGQCDQDVRARRYRKYKAQVSSTKQRQIRDHPDHEITNAGYSPRVSEGPQIICWRSRDDPPNLLHAMAQHDIADDIGDNNHQSQ